AVALAEAADADDLLILAGTGHGLLLKHMARLGEALATFEGVLRVAQCSGDQASVARALMNISYCCRLQGMIARSRAALERGVVVGGRVGDATLLAILYVYQGDLAYLTGAWQAAQKHYGQAAAVLGRIGPSVATFRLTISLGQLALAEGRQEEANRQLQEGIAIAEGSG